MVPTLMGSTQETVAGVDLGSNSYHMIVARMQQGQLHVLDKVRERVRLASGLDNKRRLEADAQERAIACLHRFAERLHGLPQGQVRAVGTNTLRLAKNSRDFLEQAHEVLGHTIEIISGREEARLIYLGVAHTLADDAGRRLVIDIGGGSTECILGERFEALDRDSLYMGCVSYTQRFFGDGKITQKAYDAAKLAAQRELASIEQRYTTRGWSSCIGSSGTIKAIANILEANGWNEGGGGITAKGLRKLGKALVSFPSIEQLTISGLEPARAPVFIGGAAILQAAFESLGIERMTPSSGALREGLIYDLVGRIQHEDVRDQTIQRLTETYHVDRRHAGRVRELALKLADQVGFGWGVDAAAARRFLIWAAELHEIGLSISYTGYHKHGAYIIANADMPGFSHDDQLLLSALIRDHRRKIKREHFAGLRFKTKPALRLCVFLRLAVALCRSRTPSLPPLTLTVKKDRFRLTFPRDWLKNHPLTRADLDEEANQLAAAGIDLICS